MERTQTLQFLAPKLAQLAQSHLSATGALLRVLHELLLDEWIGGFVRLIVVFDDI